MFFVFFLLSIFFFCAVQWVSHHIPKREKKTKNPKSKLQNPDHKASKRVCPTRVCPTSVTCVCLTSVTCVCPTSVSARLSAQQLRPERLKQFETPSYHSFCCVVCPIFSCHQSCGVLHIPPTTMVGPWVFQSRPFCLGLIIWSYPRDHSMRCT